MTRQAKQAARQRRSEDAGTDRRACGKHGHTDPDSVLFCTLPPGHKIRCRSQSRLSGSTILPSVCTDPDCRFGAGPH